MTDINKINTKELETVTGGASSSSSSWKKAKVKGVVNYLALRTAPDYDDKNETGIKFHNGDTIEVYPRTVHGSYIWARKSKGAQEGWVNKTKVSF